MKIYGKEITDECQYCGDVLQCELFQQGHGIKQERSNVTKMFECQSRHRDDREKPLHTQSNANTQMPPQIKEIYSAIWKIHKENFNPKTDEDWKSIDRKCEALLKVYEGRFVRSIIQAMIAEIEDRCKKKHFPNAR